MKAKKSNTAAHKLAEELLEIEMENSAISIVPAKASSPVKPDEEIGQEDAGEPTAKAASQEDLPTANTIDHSMMHEATGKRLSHDREVTVPNLKLAPSLQISENLRIAQKRIQGLEKELEQLRLENEQLMAAGETFRLKSDELLTQNSEMQNEVQHLKSLHDQDIHLLKDTMERQQSEIKDLKKKKEELETRIHSSVQKVRAREKELENRLELVKAEGGTLLRSKDEMILQLKKQKDLDHSELEMLRSKNQELSKKIAQQSELQRRVIKALRLALGLLDDSNE